ncbi:unnamed protein product [Protopolystoma xenopodis]|uniref:Uncharacterized protein n=1 Tax=Protopolystoma xenopodis TaxID=117903 RepID=A0A3S5C0S7_9PLAT|nr:unnamed protein product [Protopolystoma xenopodis]
MFSIAIDNVTYIRIRVGFRGSVAEWLACQASVLHCRGSNPAEGVDKTNARSKLQVPTVLHFRGSNPAEGVDKTNARSKLQSTSAG